MPAPAFRCGLFLLLGVFAASSVERLPADPVLLIIVATAAALALILRRWRLPLLMVTLGGALLLLEARARLSDRLDASQVGVDTEAFVRVADFPEEGELLRLVVRPVADASLPSKLRLSWYDAPVTPRLGECWKLTMRLRRPRGFSNPGRFDYEGWLMSRRVGATGYVRQAEPSDACGPPDALTRIRRDYAGRIRSQLPADNATAVILAVTLGARQWIDDRQWQAFAITGTSHLMAISGMHVALASGAVFLIVRLILGVAGLRVCHRDVAAAAAVVFAGAYAAVAGFGVPARRALVMLLVTVLVALCRRPVSAWQLFGAAVLVVVVTAPLDVLTPGFLLSFSAVTLLLLLAARRPVGSSDHRDTARRFRSALGELGILQFTLLLGLLPLAAELFGRLSWVSPLANLVVLPVFNVVALPAALAGVVLPGPAGDMLLLAAWRATTLILDVIAAVASLPLADLQLPALDSAGLFAALLAAAVTLLPPGWPGRSLRYIALLAVLTRPLERPPQGCADIDILDVGQGLAAVTQTRDLTMVYDAGPAFRSGSDTGQLVVAPFLRYRGVERVDLLVVSHADLDHAGGVASTLDAIDVGPILAGEPLERPYGLVSPPREIPCIAGQHWQSDGVRFTVLHPPPEGRRSGNNASCVIEIRAGRHGALFAGDIESVVERALIRDALLDPVDLVIVPHHGSKTSSHEAFVRQLSVKAAVASTGFGNRWGMPRPEVVDRWQASGANFLNTADSGAIGFRLCASDGLTLRYRSRDTNRRFWHDD